MALFLTDTHTHLYMPPLAEELDKVLARAYEAGVKRFVVIGTNLQDSRKALALAEKYENIYAAVGVHPHDAEKFSLKELGGFVDLLKSKKVLAVGEAGLDYYRLHSSKERQKEVFSIMCDLGLAEKRPLIIHARDAACDIEEILKLFFDEHPSHGIIFHCFGGEENLIRWGLERENTLFSFAGNVTYKKADELRGALARIPLEKLLVETDCPYLSPEPHRGKTCEPAFTARTAGFIANFKGISLEELAKKTEDNFQRVMGEGNRNPSLSKTS